MLIVNHVKFMWNQIVILVDSDGYIELLIVILVANVTWIVAYLCCLCQSCFESRQMCLPIIEDDIPGIPYTENRCTD